MALQTTRSTIRQGSSGEDVRFWQGIIGVNPDGNFGPITHAQTVAWQIKNQLTADGIVGPATWAKLASMTDPVASGPGFLGATATPGEQFVSFGAMIPTLEDVRTLLGRIPPPIKVASGVVGAFVGLMTIDWLSRKR